MRKRTFAIRKRRSISPYANFQTTLSYAYHSLLFGRLISKGRKILAFNKFILLKKKLKLMENLDPFLTFFVAMLKATPVVYLSPIRLGSSWQGVPVPIRLKKQITFAVKWSVEQAKNNKESLDINIIAKNLVLAIYDKGPIILKKMATNKTAKENRHLVKKNFK